MLSMGMVGLMMLAHTASGRSKQSFSGTVHGRVQAGLQLPSSRVGSIVVSWNNHDRMWGFMMQG
jgi:hypothetical protein